MKYILLCSPVDITVSNYPLACRRHILKVYNFIVTPMSTSILIHVATLQRNLCSSFFPSTVPIYGYDAFVKLSKWFIAKHLDQVLEKQTY